MDEELRSLPTSPCSFSKQGKGIVIYIGVSLADTILKKMPLSKDTNETYVASFDEDEDLLIIQKVKI